MFALLDFSARCGNTVFAFLQSSFMSTRGFSDIFSKTPVDPFNLTISPTDLNPNYLNSFYKIQIYKPIWKIWVAFVAPTIQGSPYSRAITAPASKVEFLSFRNVPRIYDVI